MKNFLKLFWISWRIAHNARVLTNLNVCAFLSLSLHDKSPFASTDQKVLSRSHPHLPRQLHWSLEYCAIVRQRSIAVIQCAAHGRSMVACPPRRSPDPAHHTTPHHTTPHQTRPHQPDARSAAPDPQLSSENNPKIHNGRAQAT